MQVTRELVRKFLLKSPSTFKNELVSEKVRKSRQFGFFLMPKNNVQAERRPKKKEQEKKERTRRKLKSQVKENCSVLSAEKITVISRLTKKAETLLKK